MLTNYADVAALAVGLVLPAIVALFTRPSTNSTVKGVAHAVLAAGTGFWAVYQADPDHFHWAPAIVASVLSWVTGTTFYHSLLKKYSWFAVVQNTLVTEVESRLHISPEAVARYVETAQVETPVVVEPAVVGPARLPDDAIQEISRIVEEVVRRGIAARTV